MPSLPRNKVRRRVGSPIPTPGQSKPEDEVSDESLSGEETEETTASTATATAAGKPAFRGKKKDEVEAFLLEQMEAQKKEGRCFRFGMFLFMLTFTILLMWLKWDKEHLAPPTDEKAANTDKPTTEVDENAEKYYSMLNVRKTDKDRRQKVQNAYEEMLAKYDPEKNPDCVECKAKIEEAKKAYQALSVHVVNDYHKVLDVPLDAGLNELKKAFKKASEEAKEGKTSWDVAEVKEAYDILSHPTARQFYQLYGQKPPEFIKHQRETTHGGWGVEIGMGTFKHTLLKAWLDYFDNIYVDIGFFLVIFLVIGIKIWNNKDDLMEKMEQIAAMEEMIAKERERRKQR